MENWVGGGVWFESGFTGFRGLIIPSPVWEEGYYKLVLSFPSFSPMRNESAKRMT